MPPSMPRNQRFETLSDVKMRKGKLIEILEAHELALAIAYDNCAPFARCLIPGCPDCDRLRRGNVFSETMRINQLRRSDPHEFVTIFLASIPAGSLGSVKIDDAHAQIRKRLERCGFRGSVLIGGTEASWIVAERVWILHLHVLAIGVDPSAWVRLRATMGNTGRAIPLKRDPLRDVVRQLSYLQKWMTLYRPGKRLGKTRSRACLLEAPQVAEICRWWANHRFEDFTFLYGVKRYGGRFVCLD